MKIAKHSLSNFPNSDQRKKHTENLQKLFNETFPYLKSSEELPRIKEKQDRSVIEFQEQIFEKKGSQPKGELRTTIGSVLITDKSTIKLARTLLDVFEEHLNNKKSKDDSNSAEGNKGDSDRISSVVAKAG